MLKTGPKYILTAVETFLDNVLSARLSILTMNTGYKCHSANTDDTTESSH